jgi:glycosyltransferase involved in cell wall biosynthesis
VTAKPLVSVVMINYNREKFVRSAIESVRGQTAGDWEFILVENGSTDHSRERIASGTTKDPRIRVMHLPKRAPIPVAINTGIKSARGKYIARLDSDDQWLPNRLATQLDWMEQDAQDRVGICGGQCELINTDGEAIGEKWFPIDHAECVRAFWVRNPFCHSAVLIRQECIAECGPYDESFEVAEDLELWMRVAQRFQLHNLPVVLVRERYWGQSVRMRQYRAMVDATLRVRLLAARRYGHRMGSYGWVAFGATWCARWCPPSAARWFFYKVFLKLDHRFSRTRNAESPKNLSARLESRTLPGKSL